MKVFFSDAQRFPTGFNDIVGIFPQVPTVFVCCYTLRCRETGGRISAEGRGGRRLAPCSTFMNGASMFACDVGRARRDRRGIN